MVPVPVDEIDLADPAFWQRPLAERDAAFATLRDERPIAHFEDPAIEDPPFPLPKGRGNYAITRYRDVVEVSRHPEVYRSGQGAISLLELPQEMVEYFSGLISTDDPRHARLRRIVSNAFNPRRIREIESTIDATARAVVTAIADRGSCDFVTDVAALLPVRIICHMMGVPLSEESTVLACANTILSGGDPEYVRPGTHPFSAFVDAAMELVAMMGELAKHRVDRPLDDLTSSLLHADIDGEALTQQELSSFFVELVIAGSETTRTAIAHGLVALTAWQDERAAWQSDVEGVTPTAVEEVVRWATPVIWMRRTVVAPTELSGVTLEPGDKVVLYYCSANRDDAAFEDPGRFDVTRRPNPHLGFGAPGPHYCLGAHLARREIAAAFRELFHQVPDVVASGPPDRLHSSFINGIKHLPCAFTPRG